MLICLITSCCLSFAGRSSTTPLPLLKSGPSAAKNGFERCWSERCWYSLNGDFDVDNNDDRIDGDGFEINLIEMLVFHQIDFHNFIYFLLLKQENWTVFFYRPSTLCNMAHIAFYWATLQTAFSTRYKLSSTWVSVWVTCDDDQMCFVLRLDRHLPSDSARSRPRTGLKQSSTLDRESLERVA